MRSHGCIGGAHGQLIEIFTSFGYIAGYAPVSHYDLRTNYCPGRLSVPGDSVILCFACDRV
jgi:hypothetical protein